MDAEGVSLARSTIVESGLPELLWRPVSTQARLHSSLSLTHLNGFPQAECFLRKILKFSGISYGTLLVPIDTFSSGNMEVVTYDLITTVSYLESSPIRTSCGTLGTGNAIAIACRWGNYSLMGQAMWRDTLRRNSLIKKTLVSPACLWNSLECLGVRGLDILQYRVLQTGYDHQQDRIIFHGRAMYRNRSDSKIGSFLSDVTLSRKSGWSLVSISAIPGYSLPEQLMKLLKEKRGTPPKVGK